jgi:hypothetical protein
MAENKKPASAPRPRRPAAARKAPAIAVPAPVAGTIVVSGVAPDVAPVVPVVTVTPEVAAAPVLATPAPATPAPVAAPVAAQPVAVEVDRHVVTLDAIRLRAYEIYRAQGGDAFQNWIQAERELGAR